MKEWWRGYRVEDKREEVRPIIANTLLKIYFIAILGAENAYHKPQRKTAVGPK